MLYPPIIRKIMLSMTFVISVQNLISQEVKVPLVSGPDALSHEKWHEGKKATIADTLNLPFIDDFSGSQSIPNPALWSDFDVYINNTYPVFPVSKGVATFDALKYDGSHYPNVSTFPYIADHLTSKPINLSFPPSDSIYLSFFYQPQGNGEPPDQTDSLCLAFFDMDTEVWNTVWKVPGRVLKPFEQVMVPIKEEKYLKKGFRFRFFNYASQTKSNDNRDLRSNVDHWNLDYVKLGRNRDINDTVLRDVAFIEPLTSILKTYTAVPWKHFREAYFKERTPFIEVVLSNHDTINRNVTRYLEMTDLLYPYTYNPTPTASDIPPGDSLHFFYPYDYPFDFNRGDSAKYLIKTYIRTDAFDYKPNDTLKFIQQFGNYYAYDDGSAEAGYGLRGNNSQNTSVAIKFESFVPDSLRAVDIYFNQVADSVNLKYYFYLKVWRDNNGKPGELVYSQLGVKPEYSPSLNKLIRYPLDSAIFVSGTFYIGWTKTVDKILNVGMDVNRNSSNRIFYNLSGTWENTQYKASLLFRPVLSLKPLSTSFHPGSEIYRPFRVFPNPANEQLIIDIDEKAMTDFSISLVDITGRKVANMEPESAGEMIIETGKMTNGIYFVFLTDKIGGKRYIEKIIIHH